MVSPSFVDIFITSPSSRHATTFLFIHGWSLKIQNAPGFPRMNRREAVSIENGEYLLPYDMRLTEALGLLRYNPAKMMVAFAAYYRDELQRKVRSGTCPSGGVTWVEATVRRPNRSASVFHCIP